MAKSIGIVGAGLSGLVAALELEKKGHHVEIFEAQDRVGGRVTTDRVGAFMLDRGFQVFLPSYPLGSEYFDYQRLSLKSFRPGAIILKSQGQKLVSDPLREPLSLFSTLFSGVGKLSDKMKVLSLRNYCLALDDDIEMKNNTEEKQTSAEFLESFGFSNEFINEFFKPFFSGIYLNKELESPAHFFKFLFKMFSSSLASLPRDGMGALPKQIQKTFKKTKVHLKTPVQEVESKAVITANGRNAFDQVILALPNTEVVRLTKIKEDDIGSRGVLTVYFKAPKGLKAAKKYLYLNASGKGPINHVACLSAVQASYSSMDDDLFSVNCLSLDPKPSEINAQLKEWFGPESSKFELLKEYPIKHALPDHPRFQGATKLDESDLIMTGDWATSPSIQGSLRAGQMAAELVEP